MSGTQNKLTTKHESKAITFTAQKKLDTAFRMDVLEKQEEAPRSSPVKIEDRNKNLGIYIEIEKDDLAIDNNVSDTLASVGTSGIAVKEAKEQCVIINVLSSTRSHKQHSVFAALNKTLWQQNLPPQPPQTWWNWIRGQQPLLIPKDYPGPLNYKPETRNHFVRLVMFKTFVMLLATACCLLYVWKTPEIKQFFQQLHVAYILMIALGLIVINYTMMCSPLSRELPFNYILLGATVLLMSALAAKVSVRYNSHVLACAFFCTSVVVLICFLMACSKFDFTQWILYVVVIAAALTAIFIAILIGFLLTKTFMKGPFIILLAISTLLQVVFLTMHLQMILGGKAIELGEEDYTLAAFMLYTSIMDVFIKTVQLMGETDR